MTNSKKADWKAIGYMRLSTDRQAEDDESFEKQAKRIREACKRRRFDLLGIYEDTFSGVDPLGAVRRDGLRDVVSRARAEGAVLVVTEPTRLFRNANAAREFLTGLDVRIFSVKDGRFMKTPALLRAIEHGEAVAHAIRSGTKEAMAKKKVDGQAFIEPSVRSRAAQASAKQRSRNAEKIAMQVADVLRSDPAYADLSNRALADLLNRRRILTGWRKQWTQHSVRPVRKKAYEINAMITEIDNDDGDALSSPVLTTASGAMHVDGGNIARSTTAKAENGEQSAQQQKDDDRPELSEEEKMLRNPMFGMF